MEHTWDVLTGLRGLVHSVSSGGARLMPSEARAALMMCEELRRLLMHAVQSGELNRTPPSALKPFDRTHATEGGGGETAM